MCSCSAAPSLQSPLFPYLWHSNRDGAVHARGNFTVNEEEGECLTRPCRTCQWNAEVECRVECGGGGGGGVRFKLATSGHLIRLRRSTAEGGGPAMYGDGGKSYCQQKNYFNLRQAAEVVEGSDLNRGQP
eukprot:358822-Chlamydomonas_euryale.AAC.6